MNGEATGKGREGFITNLTTFQLDGWSTVSVGEGVAGLITYILCDGLS